MQGTFFGSTESKVFFLEVVMNNVFHVGGDIMEEESTVGAKQSWLERDRESVSSILRWTVANASVLHQWEACSDMCPRYHRRKFETALAPVTEYFVDTSIAAILMPECQGADRAQ